MPPERRRSTASQRRAEILRAALTEFGDKGLEGTSVETIAAAVGVTQPYVFRLFGTKRALFRATVEYAFGLTTAFFADSGPAAVRDTDGADQALARLGEAYRRWMTVPLLRFQLQAYAACGDPEIRADVTRAMRATYRTVASLTQADPAGLAEFFARGLVLNVLAVLSPGTRDLTAWLADEP